MTAEAAVKQLPRHDHAEEIRRVVKEHGIKSVKIEFSDFHGICRSKALSADRFLKCYEEGLNFALPTFSLDLSGNMATGTGTAEEYGYCDMAAVPDLQTFRLVPWEERTAAVTADLHLHGRPLEVSPRNILKRVVAEYRALGLDPITASELEFYLLKPEGSEWKPYADRPSMVYTMNPTVDPGNVIGQFRGHLEALGLEVLASNHEYFPGQYEINLSHGPALLTADTTVIFKQLVKEVAFRNGLLATFMGRPLNGSGGSGYHCHMSLSDPATGVNLLYDNESGDGLSDLARWFIGGQLKHARGLMGVCAPTVNAYKRYQLNSFAPYFIVWGYDNRTTYIRVPPDRKQGTRVENRAADGSANPYLVMASILAAGLDGIKNQVDPGPAFDGDAYASADPGATGVVPRTMAEALDALEADDILVQALGPAFVKAWTAVKRMEYQRFADYVTDWEFKEYSFYL